MQIRPVPLSHPDAERLVEATQQEYVVRYGGRDETPIDPAEFDGRFFVGYEDGIAVATGGWRPSTVAAFGTTRTAEIKRMYVAPEARRRGLARRMLTHLETTAAAEGVEAMVLETGTAQPEAIGLYLAAGYEPVDAFGHYATAQDSRYFGRLLTTAAATWDGEADRFDDEPDHGLRDPRTRDAWRALLLDVLPPAPARVADLGAGTGSLAVLLAAEGYAVDAIDVSPRMVELARAKAAAAGVTVSVEVGDANAPALGAGAYDVVLDRHVLWAMDDPADAVLRWTGLLRPGGLLVLVEGRWHTGAGLDPDQVVDLVRTAGLDAELRDLPDPDLWGGPTGDRRYLVVGR